MPSFLDSILGHFFVRFSGPPGPHFFKFFVPKAWPSYCPSAVPSPEILQKWSPRGPQKVPKMCPGDPRSLENTSTSPPKASKQNFKTTSLQYNHKTTTPPNYKTTLPVTCYFCTELALSIVTDYTPLRWLYVRAGGITRSV